MLQTFPDAEKEAFREGLRASLGIAPGIFGIAGVMIPLIVNCAAAAGVVVSGAVAIWGAHWPFRLGLLAAVIAGMAAALLLDLATKEKE